MEFPQWDGTSLNADELKTYQNHCIDLNTMPPLREPTAEEARFIAELDQQIAESKRPTLN